MSSKLYVLAFLATCSLTVWGVVDTTNFRYFDNGSLVTQESNSLGRWKVVFQLPSIGARSFYQRWCQLYDESCPSDLEQKIKSVKANLRVYEGKLTSANTAVAQKARQEIQRAQNRLEELNNKLSISKALAEDYLPSSAPYHFGASDVDELTIIRGWEAVFAGAVREKADENRRLEASREAAYRKSEEDRLARDRRLQAERLERQERDWRMGACTSQCGSNLDSCYRGCGNKPMMDCTSSCHESHRSCLSTCR